MFIVLLRVEIVLETCWSSPLIFASPPKTRSPPFFGHSKRAQAGAAISEAAAPIRAARRSVSNRRRFIVALPVHVRWGEANQFPWQTSTAEVSSKRGGRQGRREADDPIEDFGRH